MCEKGGEHGLQDNHLLKPGSIAATAGPPMMPCTRSGVGTPEVGALWPNAKAAMKASEQNIFALMMYVCKITETPIPPVRKFVYNLRVSHPVFDSLDCS